MDQPSGSQHLWIWATQQTSVSARSYLGSSLPKRPISTFWCRPVCAVSSRLPWPASCHSSQSLIDDHRNPWLKLKFTSGFAISRGGGSAGQQAVDKGRAWRDRAGTSSLVNELVSMWPVIMDKSLLRQIIRVIGSSALAWPLKSLIKSSGCPSPWPSAVKYLCELFSIFLPFSNPLQLSIK